MTIGIHTWDHHPVTGYTTADWRVQLTGAKSTLERIVGHPVPWFAYPYGSWNAAALPHLADGGVVMAFQLAGRKPVQRAAADRSPAHALALLEHAYLRQPAHLPVLTLRLRSARGRV